MTTTCLMSQQDGNAPLHYASENTDANAAIFELLLAAKANANVQNNV